MEITLANDETLDTSLDGVFIWIKIGVIPT